MKSAIDYLKRIPNKKPFIDILSHVKIEEGITTINNGRFMAQMFIEEFKSLSVIAPAEKFFKAVETCKYNPKINVTAAGNLTISGGSFRTRLPIPPSTEFPVYTVEGRTVTETSDILPVFKKLRDFVGEDATRPWVSSVLFKNGYAYATNNVTIVRIPVNPALNVSIPYFYIDEVIRKNTAPLAVTFNESSIKLEWEDLTLAGAQIDAEWPASIESMFPPMEFNTGDEITPDLLEKLTAILPFCPNEKFPIIRLGEEGMDTDAGDVSAHQDCRPFNTSAWHAEVLKLLFTHAHFFETRNYPKPCAFKSDMIEGIAVGLRC